MTTPHRDLMSLEPASAPTSSGTQPTPILISRTAKRWLILALVAALLLIVWAVPAVLVISLGGFAVALVLSFPVHLFSRVVPRGVAVLGAFLILLAVLLLVFYVLAPLLLREIGALIGALPGLIENVERYLIGLLNALARRDLLPSPPEEIAARFGEDLRATLGIVSSNLLGGTLSLVFGTFSFALTVFAVIFVAASLLASERDFKTAYLGSVPTRYRHDARELWDALAYALSRYLGGLAVVLAVQGALSAAALYLIGVPYALALGAWVSITAVIPYLGSWLGAVPALLVAFSISRTAVLLTALLFLVIQMLEGNVLTPRLQGRTISVNSLVVFLGVIVGGTLGGIMGILFAVPTLAVLRVLLDFLRARLRTEPAAD